MKIKTPVIIKTLLIILTVIICIIVYIVSVNIYRNESKLKKEKDSIISSDKLYNIEDFPKTDCSVVLQNLMNNFIKNFTVSTDLDVSTLNYTDTDKAYEKLVNDEVELIIAPEPSLESLKSAMNKNMSFETTPLIQDGFVFYVSKDNKVDNLTIEQIRKIYSGEITNWKDVGGSDENIIAYQHPANSTSQLAMQSIVMNGLAMADAPKENLIDSSHQINNLVSNYQNSPNAIGYSYYYNASTMFESVDKETANNMKFISVNGIEPNYSTIRDGSYPLQTTYYIIINKSDVTSSPSRILAYQMLSARGKKVIEDSGYIPVN